MLLRGGPQSDRPVDARSRIPPGVRLVCVTGDDLQRVFFFESQFFCQVHIKIGIPVGPKGQLFPVKPHLGVMVHSFELQYRDPALQRLIRDEHLGVQVVVPLIPAGVDASGGQFAAGFGNHGIVGKGHWDARTLLLQMLYIPSVIKTSSPHNPVQPLSHHDSMVVQDKQFCQDRYPNMQKKTE